MADENNKKENRRFLGKIREQEGQYGKFLKVLIDNPHPNNEDGSASKYYKGSLIWLDAQTGKKFLVKQIAIRGVSDSAREKGFTNSISIDLDSSYEVSELE